MTLIDTLPRISVITPTCNRPVGLALARRWMSTQAVTPFEWLIIDGSRRPPGALNFLDNLEEGVRRAQGEYLVFWEDDDYYTPDHLTRLLALWRDYPEAVLVGDDTQRYYNIQHRRWKLMANKGASLCQTGMRRELIPWFLDVLATCRALTTAPKYGLDTRLWAPGVRGDLRIALAPLDTVVGVKGLPGQIGLGMGHQPAKVATWTADPHLVQFRTWVGPAICDVYSAYHSTVVA